MAVCVCLVSSVANLLQNLYCQKPNYTTGADSGCGLTIGRVECELWLLIVNDLQVQYKSKLNNSIFERLRLIQCEL